MQRFCTSHAMILYQPCNGSAPAMRWFCSSPEKCEEDCLQSVHLWVDSNLGIWIVRYESLSKTLATPAVPATQAAPATSATQPTQAIQAAPATPITPSTPSTPATPVAPATPARYRSLAWALDCVPSHGCRRCVHSSCLHVSSTSAAKRVVGKPQFPDPDANVWGTPYTHRQHATLCTLQAAKVTHHRTHVVQPRQPVHTQPPARTPHRHT
eukprot:359776-Chlamydomonas_euryale.AAC.1